MTTEILTEADVAEKPAKIWNAVFISVFATNMLMMFSQQMSNSLIAKYADFLGAPATLVGMVTGLFAVTALLFKFISAPAIDSYNRKIILAGAMSVLGLAFIGYSLANSIPMLMVSRLIQGAGMAFSSTCCLALASDALPVDKLGVGIGYFSLAQAAAQAIGPTIALKLESALGYNITFAIAACSMFFGVFVAMRLKIKFKPVAKFKISMESMIAKEAVIPATINFFLTLAFCVIGSFLVIFGGIQGMGSNIGYFFTVYAVTLLFSRPLVGRLTDKYGFVKVVIPAMVCFAISFVIISFSENLWMFLLAAFVSAFGFGACQPAVQALIMRLVPRERRGAGSCTSYIGNDLGMLAGPPIAGSIIERLGYAAMWRVMIFPIFIAILFVVIFRHRFNPE